MIFSLKTQIQRAIDSAVNSQLIPPLQSSIRAATGERPCERPDANSEGLKVVPKVSSFRKEVSEGYNPNESLREASYNPRDAHYMVTGAHEANPIPDFLTGRNTEQTEIEPQNESHDDMHN